MRYYYFFFNFFDYNRLNLFYLLRTAFTTRFKGELLIFISGPTRENGVFRFFRASTRRALEALTGKLIPVVVRSAFGSVAQT